METPETITIVVVTRNRRDDIARTLTNLLSLPERPAVIVIDNASTDETPELLSSQFPQIRCIRLSQNLGAVARNIGVKLATTRLVAFCDDDSWFLPGTISTACRVFDAHPRLALAQAQIFVGPNHRPDPNNQVMAGSPLPARHSGPGPALLGFIACGVVVRRTAFLDVGGFHSRYGTYGEERLLAIDWVNNGWQLAYVDSMVAHHYPSMSGRQSNRNHICARNDLWTVWLRRPGAVVARKTFGTCVRNPRAVAMAVKGIPWVWRERQVIPQWLEAQLRLLEA